MGMMKRKMTEIEESINWNVSLESNIKCLKLLFTEEDIASVYNSRTPNNLEELYREELEKTRND